MQPFEDEDDSVFINFDKFHTHGVNLGLVVFFLIDMPGHTHTG